ncbi:MAG: hypothetical protein SGJ19_21080 [Planctomycetia bacterium]|nr:hypothetical protein [Planctomycetia bacterium]
MSKYVRVIKLGGSLLDWPGLRDALHTWRAKQATAVDVLVVGGGHAADWIRDADRVHGLGNDAAHRLAIQAMQLNAQLAETLWPDALSLTRLDAVRDRTLLPGLLALQAWPALSDAEQSRFGQPLPHSWNVTSDSIAAWVSGAVNADELVLLKSSLPPHETIAQCAVAEYIDRYFPALAVAIPLIRAVDLRSPDYDEQMLR